MRLKFRLVLQEMLSPEVGVPKIKNSESLAERYSLCLSIFGRCGVAINSYLGMYSVLDLMYISAHREELLTRIKIRLIKKTWQVLHG